MGLASLKHDTSVAYKGTTPGISDVFQSTTQEYDFTASSLQVNNLLGDSFDQQMNLAKEREPGLFTNESLVNEARFHETLDYANEMADRPGGLPSGLHNDILFRNIERLQKDYPDAGFQTVDALYEQAGQQIRDARAKAEADYEQSDTLAGTLGWLGGTGYGALKDPLTALTMLFPELKAAKGAIGVVTSTAKVGLLEASIEAGIQAGTFQFKRDAGVDPTFDQVMADVASVGLVSALMYGGGSIIVRKLRSKIKSGEIPDTPEIQEHINNLENAQELVADTQATNPKELADRLDELRIHQSEALAGNPIDGYTASAAIKSRDIELVDVEVSRLEGDIAAITNERDALFTQVKSYHAERARLPELEQAVTGKLSRVEKKALKKDITSAMVEGDQVQLRIQSRTEASYDMMIDAGDDAYQRSAASVRARNAEIKRPIESRMAELESRFDLSEAADLAENDLRRLKVKIANDTFNPVDAALRIEELDLSIRSQDQELFALNAERGSLSKPTPEPEEVVAIKEAVMADIESSAPTQQSTGDVQDTIGSFEDYNAPPVREIHAPFGGDFSGRGGIMPTFQGGKQKMAVKTSGLFRKLWTNEERAKITQVDDYFGGGGGWGLYTAMTHFPNVTKIRLHEFDPSRLEKIKFIHQKGDQLKELLNSSKLRPVLDDVAKEMDASETFSAAPIGRRIRDYIKSNNDLSIDEVGALKTLEDFGGASYGQRVKGDAAKSGKIQIDGVIEHLHNQFSVIRKHMINVEDRGIEVEYINGNSYELPNAKGSNVLAMVDPPYYNTKGYNGEQTVPIETYNETRKLLERLSDNGNNVIYTDEAWFKKTAAKDQPKDVAKQVDGLDAYGILNNIGSRMDHFTQVPIGGRVETLGVINGFRAKRSAEVGNVPANGTGRGARSIDGRGVGPDVSEAAQRMAREGNADSGGVPSRSTDVDGSDIDRPAKGVSALDSNPKQDLSFDEQIDADIATADELASQDLPILEVDEFGNEVMRPSNVAMVKANREINAVERIMECAQ